MNLHLHTREVWAMHVADGHPVYVSIRDHLHLCPSHQPTRLADRHDRVAEMLHASAKQLDWKLPFAVWYASRMITASHADCLPLARRELADWHRAGQPRFWPE